MTKAERTVNEFHTSIEDLEQAVTKLENIVFNQMTNGYWTTKLNRDNEIIGFYCSKCKAWYPHKTNYCPNCGAKMENHDK